MSSLFDSLSEELFQVLKGSGKTLTLYGSDGNKVYDPKKARRVFAVPGNLMASVVEADSDSEVKLYLSASTDVEEIAPLINTMRQISTRYNVMFNVRKYGRELEPKDFAYQATNEAAMYGSTKTSYQKYGTSKLIVRHCAPVREGVIGSRGRNILSMFVETKDGERFKFPVTHLSGGRAFTQHINQGGKPHDVVGTQIVELAMESLQLASAARYMHHCRNILDESALALRPIVKNRIMEIRKAFNGLARPRGYTKVTEAGLPLMNSNLMESVNMDAEISRLAELLQIDTNHSLAEALKPVALLTLGENMTNMNNLFHGAISLDETITDALVEALADEYGHDTSAITRVGGFMAFSEAQAFEDAMESLNISESEYQINESDAIADYATAWTQARMRSSGAVDAAGNQVDGADGDSGERVMGADGKKKTKPTAELLADGLRAILGGNIQMPDYPERAPIFSKAADPTTRPRFILDLFVSQHKLENVATLNYVSTIIDKMAEGKKLDGAEKTIANALIDAMDKDLGMDESMVDEATFASPEDQQYDSLMNDVIHGFDAEEWIADEYPYVIDGDEKDSILNANEMKASLARSVVHMMDMQDANIAPDQAQKIATDLFAQVRAECEQRGYHFSDIVEEFAQFEDKPEHHGISAGDFVSTDKGPGQVVSIEGDIASVEFLHGGAQEMHVDDMDKVPALGKVAEEAELAEWFNSFAPRAVLEREVPEAMKPDTRVVHSVYGAGTVVGTNGKFTKVAFDRPHARLPDHRTVSLATGTLSVPGKARLGAVDEAREPMYHSVFSQMDDGTWAHHFDADDASDAKEEERWLKNDGVKTMTIRVPKSQADWTKVSPNDFVAQHLASKAQPAMAEAELDELSQVKVGSYFDKAAGDRGNAERSGDEPRLARRERGLSKAFNKMHDNVEEAVSKSPTATDYIEWNGEEDVEVTIEYSIDDGSFATGLDYPKFHSDGPSVDIDSVVIKATGEDIRDLMDRDQLMNLQQACIDDAAERDSYERDQAADYARDDRFDEDEEVLGGDQGEDLIDDTKVDEAFEAELNALIKNAMFRK